MQLDSALLMENCTPSAHMDAVNVTPVVRTSKSCSSSWELLAEEQLAKELQAFLGATASRSVIPTATPLEHTNDCYGRAFGQAETYHSYRCVIL